MKLLDLFSDGKSKTFQVVGLELKDADPWVSYINTQTKESYSCRQEAFLSRFSPLPP
jgi:hypothetical protein